MGFCNLDTEAAVAESDAINGVDRFECDSIQFGNGKSFSWKTSWAIIITRLSNPIHLQIRLIFPQFFHKIINLDSHMKIQMNQFRHFRTRKMARSMEEGAWMGK